MNNRKIINIFIINILLVDCISSIVYRRRPIKFDYSEDLTPAASHNDNTDRSTVIEQGGKQEHKEGHHDSSHEKIAKNYEIHHEVKKNKEGHHDKDIHENEYREDNGHSKEKYENEKYHANHHTGERTDKSSEFDEYGNHQKGHSTKGQHNIFKKDEYEKKHDFYDEFHESDEKNAEAAHIQKHQEEEIGNFHADHNTAGQHELHHGKKKGHKSGHHYYDDRGHKATNGHSKYHKYGGKHASRGGRVAENKWAHRQLK